MDEGDHLEKVVDAKRLGEHAAPNGRDKFIYLSIAAVSSHEDESITQVRAHAFHRTVKHIAGKRRHHHVAKDHLEVARQDLMHAFHSVLHRNYLIITFLQEGFHRLLERWIILEKEDLSRSGLLLGIVHA